MSWLTSLISPIIDGIKHLTKSRVSLKIDSLLLHPKWAGEIKGYVGEVKVTNKGKKIAYNLTANIDVERDGIYAEVLEVKLVANGRVTRNGKVITIVKKKEPASNVDYKWRNEKKRRVIDVWEKLRQNDFAFPVFPKKFHPGVAILESPIRTSTINFLKLWPGVEHRVTITVKAETSEKNTVSATRTFRFEVGDEDDASSIFVY